MLAIGKAIRIMRTQKGLSQKELAERAGVTPSFVSLVEGSRRSASLKVIDQLASAMGTSVEVLLWEAVELPPNLNDADRRMCEFAKLIVRRVCEHADREADDPTPV